MNPQEYGELSVEGRAVYIAETARAVRPSRRVDLGTLAKHAVVEKRSHDGVGKGRRVVKAVASIDFRCREITADVVSFIVAGGTLMAVAVLVSRLRSAAPSIGDEFARAGVASAFFTWVVIGGVTFVVAFVLDFVAEGRGGSRRIARVLQTPSKRWLGAALGGLAAAVALLLLGNTSESLTRSALGLAEARMVEVATRSLLFQGQSGRFPDAGEPFGPMKVKVREVSADHAVYEGRTDGVPGVMEARVQAKDGGQVVWSHSGETQYRAAIYRGVVLNVLQNTLTLRSGETNYVIELRGDAAVPSKGKTIVIAVDTNTRPPTALSRPYIVTSDTSPLLGLR